MEELTEEELKAHLEEERHDELMKSLNCIEKALKENKFPDNSALIQKNIDVIGQLSKKISELKSEKEVKIDHSLVIKSIEGMAKEIKESLLSLKKEEIKKEWTFNVKRNSFGFIESVTVK